MTLSKLPMIASTIASGHGLLDRHYPSHSLIILENRSDIGFLLAEKPLGQDLARWKIILTWSYGFDLVVRKGSQGKVLAVSNTIGFRPCDQLAYRAQPAYLHQKPESVNVDAHGVVVRANKMNQA